MVKERWTCYAFEDGHFLTILEFSLKTTILYTWFKKKQNKTVSCVFFLLAQALCTLAAFFLFILKDKVSKRTVCLWGLALRTMQTCKKTPKTKKPKQEKPPNFALQCLAACKRRDTQCEVPVSSLRSLSPALRLLLGRCRRVKGEDSLKLRWCSLVFCASTSHPVLYVRDTCGNFWY